MKLRTHKNTKEHEVKFLAAMQAMEYTHEDIDVINSIRGAIQIGMDLGLVRSVAEHIDNKTALEFLHKIETKYAKHFDVLNKGAKYRPTMHPDSNVVLNIIERDMIQATEKKPEKDMQKLAVANAWQNTKA